MKKEFLTKEEVRKVMDSAACAFLPPEEYNKLRDNIFSGWHNYDVCQCTDGYYTFFSPWFLDKLSGVYSVSYNRDTGIIKFYAGSLDKCFAVPASAPIFEEVFGDSVSETPAEMPVETSENCGTFSNLEEEKESPKIYKSFADYLIENPVFVETDYVEVENEDGKNLLTSEEEEEFSRLIAEVSGPDGDDVVEEEEKVKEIPVIVAFPITLSDSEEEERTWIVIKEKEEER